MYENNVRSKILRDMGYPLFRLGVENPTNTGNKDQDKKDEDENPINYDYIHQNGGMICPGSEWGEASMSSKSVHFDKGLALRLQKEILNLKY
jgi:hypothetical protein